jgi:hypothetical protein
MRVCTPARPKVRDVPDFQPERVIAAAAGEHIKV